MEEEEPVESLENVEIDVESTSMENQPASSSTELLEMIETLRMQLQQERIAREVIVSANQRADKSLAKMLADAWRAAEEEKEAHRLSLEEISRQREECSYYRRLFDQMQRSHNAERASAKEARKAVVALQDQLLTLQLESDNVLNQLVKVKVDYANKCMEYDDLERNYAEVVRLISHSQARIEQLEAKLVTLSQQLPVNASTSHSSSLSESQLSSNCSSSTPSTPIPRPIVSSLLCSQEDLRPQPIHC